jgi:hypothetical protein
MANGAVLGMRAFAREFERTRARNLDDAATHIMGHAEVVRGDAPQSDDWTFVLMQWE